MAELDTPSQGETGTTPALENDAQTPAPGAGVDSKVLEAQLDAERKARQQAEMRTKQLENQRQEEERKRKEEQGQYKELYEKTAAELAEKDRQREMDELLKGYDPKVQETAKKLFGAGDLPTQLAALQEVIKPSAPQTGDQTSTETVEQPAVTPMNPNPRTPAPSPSVLKPEMDLSQMEEALEKKTKGLGL